MAVQCDVDLDADYYTSNSTLQYGVASRLLDHYQFLAEGKILDIGCGDGRITAEIASKAPKGQVVGLDSSPSMIEFAKKNYGNRKNPNLSFILEKAENLSLKNQFDTVVSFNCFHWIRKGKEALKRICASLKSKGEILILTYPKESPYYEFMQKALSDYPDYAPQSAYHTMLGIKDYQDELKKEGMDIIKFEVRNLKATYQNEEEIKDFIRGWLTNFVPLPKDLHEEYLDRVIKESWAFQKKEGEMITIPYTELSFHVKKLSLLLSHPKVSRIGNPRKSKDAE